MAPQGNTWAEYRKHIVETLDRLDDDIGSLEEAKEEIKQTLARVEDNILKFSNSEKEIVKDIREIQRTLDERKFQQREIDSFKSSTKETVDELKSSFKSLENKILAVSMNLLILKVKCSIYGGVFGAILGIAGTFLANYILKKWV